MESFDRQIEKLFAPYEFKARVWPALLVLLPVLVVLACKFGQKATNATAGGSVLLICGSLYCLARWTRTRGVALQDKLWAPWGGTPTIRYLRHREKLLDPPTIERYHSALAVGIGKKFPNAREEEAAPDAADDLYRSGIRWLKEQTRDTKKYTHLHKENIAYGFHRNMLGVKPTGIAVAVGSLLAALYWSGVLDFNAPFVELAKFKDFSYENTVAVLVPAATLWMWIFAVTRDGMERASMAYMERLLQTCEGFTKPAKKKSTKPKSDALES